MLIDTDELLEELYKKFPDQVPDKEYSLHGYGVKLGEQRPMKYIEHWVEQKQHEADSKAKKLRK